MHGWHNLKRCRLRRGRKAAGSTRVGGNEGWEFQIVAPRRRFKSQNISAVAVEPEVNFSSPKCGRGGGIASTTASCDDGFNLGNLFAKGASSTPHATSRFDVAGNAAAKLVESCSKQRRMGASGSRATCTLRTKLTCHYDARLRRTESHGKLGGTPRPAAEGSYGTSSSQIPYELLEVHLGSLFSRTTNWLTSGEGNR